jgi:hypothetical protein
MPGAIRELLDAFLAKARSVLAPFSSLEIVRQDDDQLVLKNNSRQFIVNKRLHNVTSGTQVIALFDAIESIDIARHRTSDKAPEYWSVSLTVKGQALPVIIGHSLDDADASIVAARISALTGKNVRAS